MVALTPLGGALAPVLPSLHRVLAPHYHWILWVIISFMVLSEWPQGRTAGLSPGRRLWSGLRNVVAGLATFLLAGLLGMILFLRSPLPIAVAMQGLTPAFAGLFAVPWLLLNIASRVRIPAQRRSSGVRPDLPSLLHGWAAGIAGGAFAAFLPVVSGGIGSLIAGHALSTRSERTFLVAQGACRAVYYTGAGLLLLFMPGLGVARGGAAAMLKGVHAVRPGDMTLALAAVGIAGALALWGIVPLARLTLRLLERQGYRRVSFAALALLVILIAGTGGVAGLAVMAVATGIGLIPALFGARRLNALGVVLLPMACAMSGFMPVVSRLLGPEDKAGHSPAHRARAPTQVSTSLSSLKKWVAMRSPSGFCVTKTALVPKCSRASSGRSTATRVSPERWGPPGESTSNPARPSR